MIPQFDRTMTDRELLAALAQSTVGDVARALMDGDLQASRLADALSLEQYDALYNSIRAGNDHYPALNPHGMTQLSVRAAEPAPPTPTPDDPPAPEDAGAWQEELIRIEQQQLDQQERTNKLLAELLEELRRRAE